MHLPGGGAEAFFVEEAGRLVPTAATRGPWSDRHQHGGPPAAAMARAIERAVAGEDAALVARFTLDLARPVPLAPLSVRVQRVRDGRRVRGFAAVLSAGDQEIARASALLIRTEPLDLPPPAPGAGPPHPETAAPFAFPFFTEAVGYHTAMETRLVGNAFGTGAAFMWLRMRVPLVAGEAPSPLQRVLIAADSGSGVSAALDSRRFTFVNADLSVHLHRLPEGEWVGLDSATTVERHGVGLARTMLVDRQGPVGSALQSLVLAERQG
ncbi:MAG TPA: thioesterase family protein [Candidatus Binatia bacterium]|nr:thioesterase family protein [Candidatus Binatia bacterium]